MLGGGGMDAGVVFRHPVFLITFIIAIPSWIIAFAGQCATEAKYSSTDSHAPVAGTLWFTIWLELVVIVGLFLSLASDGLAFHRFQLSIFFAIATALAIFGVQFLFQTGGAYIATGVGWLLLTMVNLIWLLYLTSEEDTFVYNILNSGGNGGLSSNRRIGGSVRRESSAGYGGGEMGLGGNSGGGMTRGISSNNVNGGAYGGGGYVPAATDGTPQKLGTLSRGDFNNGAQSPGSEDSPYKQRAKALYAYSASPDDPNEVSFMKGDILDVVDCTGKWFQVRTPSGATGIAPSNYLVIL